MSSAWPVPLRNALLSLIVLVASYVAGRIGERIVGKRIGALARRTAADWDDAVVAGIARRVPFWSLLAGVYIAGGFWTLPGHLNEVVNRILFVVAAGSVTLLAADIASQLVRAYGRAIDPSLPGTSLIENLIRIAVVAVGALIVLNGFGVSITPILGALGVGGLAVALALQDTLANLFAGFYMTLAKQIRIGDYIKLPSGEEGYVEDVDWRATRLRMLPNNTVLVPNAKLSQSIVINYHLPDLELAVLVEVGVDYDSDLENVERVTVEVARDVQTTVPGGVPSFEPFIRYHTFADSSVNFTVILRGKEFVDQHLLKHEFVKRLHRRYRDEGIVIPFPIRTVISRATSYDVPMTPFDVAAVLIAIAATAGYVNFRLLKLPATSGTLVVALVSSFVVVAAEAVFPQIHLRADLMRFLSRINFEQTLMRGMLCFLLFAGALHVNARELMRSKWTIGALATVGVALSTAIIGGLTWLTFGAIGARVPLVICLVFGALISPTDPIAVMGLLKELRTPASLEAQIAGESLFNDGVGVVIFFALLSVAGLPSGAETTPGRLDAAGLTQFLGREVVGGFGLGLALGYVGYRALKSIDDHPLELLITLALAMFLYAVSFWIGVSGPIAIVTAGLLIGNRGRQLAMSERTRVHVDAFWSMVDEILNAVLFVLIGLEVLAVQIDGLTIAAGLLAVPIALAGRLMSVSVPIAAMSLGRQWTRGMIPVLTWSGLRGGISVAMVLSLPPFPTRDLLVACTYAVVVFSILVQGLTMRRVLARFGPAPSAG